MMLRSLRRFVGLTNDLPSRSESGKKRAKQPSRARLGVEELEDRCPVCGIPPTAFDDEYWVTAGDTLIVPVITGVLANDSGGGPGGDGDTDPCGTTLYAVLVEGPSEGTLSLLADGSFEFTKDDPGGVTFKYMACDDQNYCSTVATVVVNVAKKPGNITFSQDTGPAAMPWSDPANQGNGAFYQSSPPGTWATSWVTVWAGSGQTPVVEYPGAGSLHATLTGSKNATYVVSLQIDVSISATGNAGASATLIWRDPSLYTIPGTNLIARLSAGGIPPESPSASYSNTHNFTVTLGDPGFFSSTASMELIVIEPGLAANDTGSADFLATIYRYAIQ
ncbi:MAG: Ig-like domain-containing protein [Planctomycetes bacterium]|nr:Ig-like domain-containing protein [Planctomycetota bacterium]